MKIVMVAQRFHPHLGGVEKHLWEICSVLLKRGYTVTVVTERYDDKMVECEQVSIDGNNLEIIRVTGQSYFPGGIKTFWTSLLKIRQLFSGADITHIHDFGVFIYWYLPLKFLYPRKPVYITFHGWEGVFPPPSKVVFLRKVAELLTKGNICIGDFISKWYGTKPDYVSYGGVHVSESTAVGGDGTALFLGRLAPDTGIMLYLEGLKKLYHKGIGLRLIVCGDGPSRQVCEEYVKKHALKVDFKGFVQDTGAYLETCDFAFVAGYLSILEAMSMGKVVFSVYENPLKEDYLRLLPDNDATMFISRNAEELSEQLFLCIQNRTLLEQKIKNARSWVRSRSWEEVVNTYERLWSKK